MHVIFEQLTETLNGHTCINKGLMMQNIREKCTSPANVCIEKLFLQKNKKKLISGECER